MLVYILDGAYGFLVGSEKWEQGSGEAQSSI